jgi:hypothetical protein
MAQLDDKACWFNFTCPCCLGPNVLELSGIGFSFDIDMTVSKNGLCPAELVVQCEHCKTTLTRNLKKE